jgi:hypothetical protein
MNISRILAKAPGANILGAAYHKAREELAADRTLRARALVAIVLPPVLVAMYAIALPLVVHNQSTVSKNNTTQNGAEGSGSGSKLGAPDSLRAKAARLEAEKGFLQAYIKAAKSDSLGLAVDLPESTITIAIKGCPVRICRIESYHFSKVSQSLWRSQGNESSGDPYRLSSMHASMTKDPVKIKKAPKDTTEANALAPQFDSIPLYYASCRLLFSNTVAIHLKQSDRASFMGLICEAAYALRSVWNGVEETVWWLAHLRIPRHALAIDIRVQKSDVVAVYRGLDRGSPLALALE